MTTPRQINPDTGRPIRGEAVDFLSRIGRAPDDRFDLGEAALMLASLDRPQVSLDRYRLHLEDLAAMVAHEAGTAGSADDRAGALAAVIHEAEGYRGDELTYDDLQNANMMRVIDRRRGLPVALGILYIRTARAQGWRADGLAFPGHFLVSIEGGSGRVIFDPFAGTPVPDASALRAMIKSVSGSDAELTPDCYAVLDDRHVLLRLQNNIKTRLAAQGRFEDAVDAARRMLLIAPEEPALHRDLGLYHAESGNLMAAIEALGIFIDKTQDEEARHIASALIQKIRSRLN